MNLLFIFATSAFFLWIIREIFLWASVWQDNEYRVDRLLLSLRNQRVRKTLFFTLQGFFTGIIFLGYIFVVFYDSYLVYYQIIVFCLYLYQAFVFVKEIYLNSLRKPVLTTRVIFIIFFSFGVLVLLYSFQLMDRFFWLVLLDLLVAPLVSLLVFIFAFPIELYVDIQQAKAAQLIAEHPDLIVIGVTGSYGKSATKDSIAEILSKKFKILKTNGHDNTALGIASTIVKGLKRHTQVLIVEIGGYKREEVQAIASLLKPKIAVVTGINAEYISLFGSLENKKKANLDLVEAVQKDGLVIFNGDNRDTVSLYKKTKKAKALCMVLPLHKGNRLDTADSSDIVAFHIVEKHASLSCDIRFKNQTIHLVLPDFTLQSLEYLLPAIYVADYLGMKVSEIKKVLK